jgi:hypothetical protein
MTGTTGSGIDTTSKVPSEIFPKILLNLLVFRNMTNQALPITPPTCHFEGQDADLLSYVVNINL